MSTEVRKGAGEARLGLYYAFAPYADTSAIVATKRIRARGQVCDVIHADLTGLRQRDETLDTLVAGLVRKRREIPGKATFSGWRATEAYVKGVEATVREWERSGAVYSEIDSRAHFLASHVAAALVRRDRPHARWHAEFSDPLSTNGSGRVRFSPVREGSVLDRCRRIVADAGFQYPTTENAYELTEQVAFAVADKIIFTNVHQADYMLGKCSDPALADAASRRVVVKPHPVLDSAAYRLASTDWRPVRDRINIGYFGNFYERRRAQDISDALAGLDSHDRAAVAVNVFTTTGKSLREAGERYSLGESLRVYHQLPFLEFLHASTLMDILLIMDTQRPDGAQASPFLPSKLGDYRGAHVPLWAVVDEGSALDEIAPDVASYVTPVRHVTAMQQALVTLARGHRARRVDISSDRPASGPGPRAQLAGEGGPRGVE